MTRIIPIPAFADNYIWLLRDGTAAAVVDPGDANPVLAYLAREGLTLTAILATHHHGDHVGGVPALLARYPVPVFGPAHESIPGRTRAMGEGDVVTVPGLPVTLRGIDIPGHTAGHIAYFGDVDGTPSVFCGDTLFAAGCGRMFEGTPAQMWTSLGEARGAAAGHARLLRARVHARQPALRAWRSSPTTRRSSRRQSREQAKRDRQRAHAAVHDRGRARDQSVPAGADPAVRAAAEQHAGHALPDDVGRVCGPARVEERVLTRRAR